MLLELSTIDDLMRVDIDPAPSALGIKTVKYAKFHRVRATPWTGVVYDAATGIEFDVRQDGARWNVNDDEGRDFRSRSLKKAIKRAIRANR